MHDRCEDCGKPEDECTCPIPVIEGQEELDLGLPEPPDDERGGPEWA